jgi:predicted DNA-binding transcriptional regulator YafY
LVLGARIVAAWGDADLAAAVGSAMTKVEAVLPDTLRRVLLETPFFAPGPPGASAMAGELALLRRAIGERRFVHFRYTREDGAESERDARPLGLYFWGRKWTLASWCELRNDYRSFRPDRMRDVQLLERRFDPTDGISLAGFLAKGDPADWEKWEWRQRGAAADSL